jgi:hypothetical protein
LLAWHLGQRDFARNIVERARARIAVQISPDGSQPMELTRTQSLHYSIFNIEAWMTLAAIGRDVGVDIWDFQTPDGRCIKKAIDFVARAAVGLEPWPYPQIGSYDPIKRFLAMLYQAEAAYKTGQYRELIQHLPEDKVAGSTASFLFR